MKSKTGILILALIVACVVGLLFFIYMKYELPQQEIVTQYSNITVAVFDDDRNQIIVDMSVNVNGAQFKNVTTTSHGFVLVKVPLNSSIVLSIDEDDYYHFSEDYYFSVASSKRVTIDLASPGMLNITSTLDTDNNQINLAIVADSDVRQPKLCAKWGLHIIWLQSIDRLQAMSAGSYDKCFQLDSINSTSKTFSFTYDNYGIFTEADFINFYIIDEKKQIVIKEVKFINSKD
jgi:hypothetical protein